MIKSVKGQRIDTIFVLIIFCVFAVSVLMILMFGASIYKNINSMSRDGHSERTALSYIWTKAKNGDDAGSVHVGDFHGLPTLCIDEEISGTTYRTSVYYYNGWIYELFSESSLDFLPEDGTRVIEVSGISFEEFGYGLIKVSAGSKYLLIYTLEAVGGPETGAVFPEGVHIG